MFGIVEPSLSWPKSARIGFYGPRQHRRPMPGRCEFFCQSRWKILSGAAVEVPKFLFSAPGGLQERFWRALGAEVARRRRPRRSRRPPGSIFGDSLAPKAVLFFVFFSSFRGMVFFACIWTVVCSTFFLFEGCSRSARKRRTRRLYHKTNGFKHMFKLCFRAGECRGEQNTHGSGKKTHAKTAPKKQTFL